MLNRANVIYEYDGSFEGLLCCVFESYEKKEIPSDIVLADKHQVSFFPTRKILTDTEKSSRVLASIPKKIGNSALEFIEHSFLTCLPEKEFYILMFLRMGYSTGPSVMNMLSNDVVNTLFKAVKHLKNESHLLKGFVRFSSFNGWLAAEIEPKNYVLPLLKQHFCERYPEENFLIYDKTHGMLLLYEPYKASIISAENMELNEPTEEEKHFRELWKLYYNTVEIEGRRNPKCRMTHMPKRYWNYLTEFK